jgi:hypothetical protein
VFINSNTALGFNALKVGITTSIANNAIGYDTLAAVTSGASNTSVGDSSMCLLTTGSCNVALGSYAGVKFTTGSCNVVLGQQSGSNATGSNNTFVGYNSACAATTGSCNVAIGNEAALPVVSGSCQLVIGYNGTNNWLTGCSNKAIRPGAGIMDCTGSTGSAGQALTSTGSNSVRWVNTPVIYCCAISNINASSSCCVAALPGMTAGVGNSGCYTVVLCNTTVAGGVAELQSFCWIQETATTVCTTSISANWPGSNLIANSSVCVAGSQLCVLVTNGLASNTACGKIVFQNTP